VKHDMLTALPFLFILSVNV